MVKQLFSKVCRYRSEIELIGIWDWLWFVVYLKKGEFSGKLRIPHLVRTGVDPRKCSILVTAQMGRAHYLGIKLKGMKGAE